MYALHLKNDGRILHVTDEKFVTNIEKYNPDDPFGEPIIVDLMDGYVLVDAIPEGDATEYRYVNGEYIYDPLPKIEVQAEPTAEEILKALLGVTE